MPRFEKTSRGKKKGRDGGIGAFTMDEDMSVDRTEEESESASVSNSFSFSQSMEASASGVHRSAGKGAGATGSPTSRAVANAAASAKEPDGPEETISITNFNNTGSTKRVTCADFALLRLLGVGSFGKVFQVRHRQTNKVYAMKVLRKATVVRSRKGPAYLKTERTILEAVKHPFIVGLQYAFQTDGKLYLIMDYLNGGELFYHLSKKKYFSEQLVRFYAAEIVLAISHLHSLGIVYRDLKPENLCLDTDGHVVLTDFGLAKEAVDRDDVTATSFCGTAEYMAPEILNRGGHGRAVDWWSLGTLVYEMLTGTPPFSGGRKRDEKAIQNLILTAKAPIPKKWSAATKDFVRRLLEKDASKRLGSGPNGDTDIMTHPFFESVDWDAVYDRQIKPPYKPVLPEGQDDASNFDPKFTNMTPVDSPVFLRMNEVNGFRQMDEFNNFSYVAPSAFEKAPEDYPRPSLVPNTPAALAAAEQDKKQRDANGQSASAISSAMAVPDPQTAAQLAPQQQRPRGTADAQPAFYTSQPGASSSAVPASSSSGNGSTRRPSDAPVIGFGAASPAGQSYYQQQQHRGSSNGQQQQQQQQQQHPTVTGFAPSFNPYAAPFAPRGGPPLQWGHGQPPPHYGGSGQTGDARSPPRQLHFSLHRTTGGSPPVNGSGGNGASPSQQGGSPGGGQSGSPGQQDSPGGNSDSPKQAQPQQFGHGPPVSFYQPQQLRQTDPNVYYNGGQYGHGRYGHGPYGWR